MHGLVGITDSESLGRAMLAGGCRNLQLRRKGSPERETLAIGRRLLAACAQVGAVLIVNDDPALAALIGAHGVHLGQTDGPLARARALLPRGILGRSTHTAQDVREAAAQGADYLGFGPVFDTPNLSRPKPVRGLAALREIRATTRLPLVAIGGITADNVDDVRLAGADGWAVIGAIARAADPVAATRALV